MKQKFKIHSKLNYNQSIDDYGVIFDEIDLECDTLNVVIFLKFLCFLNLGTHFCEASFELKNSFFGETY